MEPSVIVNCRVLPSGWGDRRRSRMPRPFPILPVSFVARRFTDPLSSTTAASASLAVKLPPFVLNALVARMGAAWWTFVVIVRAGCAFGVARLKDDAGAAVTVTVTAGEVLEA